MKRKTTKLAVFTVLWFLAWAIIPKFVYINKGLLFAYSLGGYQWILLLSALRSRRMKKELGDIDRVLIDLEKDMAAKELEGYCEGLRQKIATDEEYRGTTEYKYEVLDSMSIRQIERYLDIRKKSSD